MLNLLTIFIYSFRFYVHETIFMLSFWNIIVYRNIINCINEFKKKYSGVYFLPASRSGIYSGMSAFSSIVAELSKSRSYITKKIELPGISEPISDYFITLSNIQPEPNNGLAGFYTDIENNILKGRVSFDNGKKALMYRPVNVDADFGMTEVSSMVSEKLTISSIPDFLINCSFSLRIRSLSSLSIQPPS